MSVMHVVFAAVGAMLGGAVEPAGGWLFGALVGASIGYAIAEFTLVRGRILTMEKELARLRANLARRGARHPGRAEPFGKPVALCAGQGCGL